ncbi:ABC transporter [Nocardioides mangrovicus]|uniref:ABC transporter n=1 Tax=Nocardioides mangrovicus TaxID=2478913 RepID=A0A3L8P4D2_9ACTN|nr:ABC transporter permease [Nocardioides mangrovicus]RLV49912.1 ABC transporter [Nocardioides mangrovicus]
MSGGAPTSREERREARASHPMAKETIEESRDGRKRNAAKRARKMARKKADSMPVVEALEAPQQTRVVEGELVTPAPAGGVVGLFKAPYLLRLLVRREIAKMYSASVLGLLWSYIQPGLRFGVYYLVFGVLLDVQRSLPNFAIHLFCGIVFTHFFSEVFNGGTRSIWENRTLVKKMAMPRETFPIAHVIVGYYHIFPQILLLFICCLLSGFRTDLTGVVALFLGTAIISVFGMAVALLFSAVNVYYRDFQNVTGTITQMLHFMVPMMYGWDRIAGFQPTHPVLVQLYLANPVCDSVILLQRFFWTGVNMADGDLGHNAELPPHMLERGGITLACCLVFLVLCQWAFSRLEHKFPERL